MFNFIYDVKINFLIYIEFPFNGPAKKAGYISGLQKICIYVCEPFNGMVNLQEYIHILYIYAYD